MSEPAEGPDFAEQEGTAPSTAPAVGAVKEPYNADIVREDVRKWVTYALVLVLAVVVAFGLFQYGLHADKNEDVLRFTTGLLSPIIALVGPVIGFYFGEKAAAKENGGAKSGSR